MVYKLLVTLNFKRSDNVTFDYKKKKNFLN